MMKFEVGFRPKLLEALKTYSFQDFLRDGVAGVTVGIVALSLAMALGIASNATPAAGIYTAIVAGFLLSALGGAKAQIDEPTAVFISVVEAVSAAYGLESFHEPRGGDGSSPLNSLAATVCGDGPSPPRFMASIRVQMLEVLPAHERGVSGIHEIN